MRLPGGKDLPDGALPARIVAGAVDLVRYFEAVLADDLATGPAYLAAVGLVGRQDTVIPVDDNKALVHGVQNARMNSSFLARIFLLSQLLFGDVLPSSAQNDLRTSLIAPRARLGVDLVLPVPQVEPVVDAEMLSRVRVSSMAFQGRPVVRMILSKNILEVSRILHELKPE
jgi:hypothetical protein